MWRYPLVQMNWRKQTARCHIMNSAKKLAVSDVFALADLISFKKMTCRNIYQLWYFYQRIWYLVVHAHWISHTFEMQNDAKKDTWRLSDCCSASKMAFTSPRHNALPIVTWLVRLRTINHTHAYACIEIIFVSILHLHAESYYSSNLHCDAVPATKCHRPLQAWRGNCQRPYKCIGLSWRVGICHTRQPHGPAGCIPWRRIMFAPCCKENIVKTPGPGSGSSGRSGRSGISGRSGSSGRSGRSGKSQRSGRSRTPETSGAPVMKTILKILLDECFKLSFFQVK